MKAIKLIAVLAVLLMSSLALAVCPTQKTTIFFINGVDNTRFDAIRSKDLIEDTLKPLLFFNPSCVTIKLAYSRTEGLTTDILEAARQKEIEEDLTPTNFWEMFTRLVAPRPWFMNLMASAYIAADRPNPRDAKIFAQIVEHLNGSEENGFEGYRKEMENGNSLILLGHSQGTLFGNEEYMAMTTTERSRTKLIAVATPAFAIADGGPYTTIEEDKLITNTFVGELVPNVPAPNRLDEQPCPDDWLCHGIETSYLFPNTASRVRILADIKRLLSAEPPPFFFNFVSGTLYRFDCDGGRTVITNVNVHLLKDIGGGRSDLVAQTFAHADGTYHMIAPLGTFFIGLPEVVPGPFPDPFVVSAGETTHDVFVFGICPL